MKKYILITGAGSGIGKAIAQYLVQKDFYVFASDINSENLSYCEESEELIPIVLDVTLDSSISKAYQEIKFYTSSLFALVNNAGFFDQFPLVEGESHRLNKLLDVNVFGAYKVFKKFFPLLLAEKGRIINMSSESAKTLLPFLVYGLSKRILEDFSEVLRQELALLGLKVILIRPGAHKTALIQHSHEVLGKIPKDSLYQEALKYVKKRGQKALNKTKNEPVDVAKVVHKALIAKKPRNIYSINMSSTFKFLPLLPKKWKEYLIRRSITR